MVTSTGTFVSCKDYDDDIDSLWDSLKAVEGLVADLQSQIQKGAIITNVSKTETGVKITLNNGNDFELTNGVDGKPGSVIEIKEDGYWYIDGVKTEYKAQGEKGDKGDQGEKGDKGEIGGVTPVYYYPGVSAAEDGYWVKVTVAEDGTETKTVTNIKWAASGSSATGVTALWSNKSLILRGVQGTDKDLVITLDADLRALVFQPEMVLDGQNAMEYIYIPYKPVTLGKGVQSSMLVHQIQTAEGYAEREEKYTVKESPIVAENWTFLNPTYNKEYHMDPTTAVISEFTQNNLGVTSGDRDFVSTPRAAAANPMAVWFRDVVDGKMQVGIQMEGQKVKTQEEGNPYNLGIFYPAVNEPKFITDLAIQAPLDESKKEVITSTYASVYASQIAVEGLAYETSTYANSYIIQKAQFNTDKLVGPANVHNTPLNGGRHLYNLVTDAAEQSATVEIAYTNADGINLNELVTTHVGANSQRSWNNQATWSWTQKELKAHGMKYEFERVPFSIGDNATEQSQNHCVLQTRADGNTYIVPCGVKSNSDVDIIDCEPDLDLLAKAVSSVGRTPLIRVVLKDTINNQNVKIGYIKFKIVAPENPLETAQFDLGEYYYRCGEFTKTITWHAIESKLLEATRNTSKETFDATYEIVANADGNVAQWIKTNQTDVNGKPIYASATEIGVIKELKDDGAETTNVLSWTLDRNDFVQCVNDDTYPEVEEIRYVKYAPKKYLGNSNFNVEPVYLPIKITLRYPKAIMANKIAKYWYADNSMNDANSVLPTNERKNLHANVEVPGTTTDIKAADCDFYFELDSRFELNITGHSDFGQWYSGYTLSWQPGDVCFARNENAPTFTLDPAAWSPAKSWNTPANFPSFVNEELVYYYYFTLANNGRTVEGVSGTTYTLSVDNTVANNNVMLFTETNPYEYKNRTLKANGTVIAELHYNLEAGHIRKHGVWLELKNNDAAKDLLNLPTEWKAKVTDTQAAIELLSKTLDVNIGVATFNKDCGAYLPLVDNTFNVEILKPVYAEPDKEINFVDAHDGGTAGTEVYLADLVKFYDWRQYDFAPNNLDYYNYYEVSDISVNPEDIMTDINGTMQPLKDTSLDVEFHVIRGGVRVDNGYVTTTAANIPSTGITWAQLQEHFGKLTYTNNTGTVVNFDIKVPVKITHKWSQKDFVVWVNGHVGRTEAN
ncbi:MAG: PL29 family lyase N-terminal domain-containing protein [Bacteroidales bacterium]|nr:PL29 family lyase N-terminal domain-containing protein [Bacteroidales bacterium]